MFEFNNFILSQIFAFFAIISNFIVFQFKKRDYILISLGVTAFFLAIHYTLLFKFAAALLFLIAMFRSLLFLFTTHKKYLIIILTINTLVFILLFDGWILLFQYFGLSFLTIGSFQKDNKKLRIYMMFGILLILIYNILIFTPFGILKESIFLISGIIGYYRFRKIF